MNFAKYLTPKSFTQKRLWRCVLNLVLIMLWNLTLSPTQTLWAPILVLLLSQQAFASPTQKTLANFFLILLLLFGCNQLFLFFPINENLKLILLAVTVIATCYSASRNSDLNSFSATTLTLSVISLALILPIPAFDAPFIWDLTAALSLVIASNLFFFPDRPDLEFPRRVGPFLAALNAYFADLITLYSQEPAPSLAHHRDALESLWANKATTFPLWVFEPGFNPALKPGQYYFAIHLGQISEIMFALHHLARHRLSTELLSAHQTELDTVKIHTQKLFAELTAMLVTKNPEFDASEFREDVEALEEKFRQTVNVSLELLDISPDYLNLAAFIRYLKDLRQQLLGLAQSLRS